MTGCKSQIDPLLSSFIRHRLTTLLIGFSGVGQANQTAGFANNQNNVVNVAFGTKGALIATSDAVLEQVNVNNNVCLTGRCQQLLCQRFF